MKEACVAAWAGHDGRTLRVVVGSEALPELPFVVPGATGWASCDDVILRRVGARFSLEDRRGPILTGSAEPGSFRVAIDVGGADVLGFGATPEVAIRDGARFRVMTRDTLLYGIPGASYTAMPFFIARDGARTTGVLLATTLPLDVDVSSGQVKAQASCDTQGAPLDLVVLRGSLAGIVRDLAALIGHACLPPAWALGFHQSRWSYRTSAAVLHIARRFRELDLPADVIHLDIHHMDRYRVFTFDPRRFPKPRQMHDELRGLGFRTLAIVDPGVSAVDFPVHDILRSGDMLLTRRDGRPYVGRVWPGATVFPDFTQPHVRETWGRFHAGHVAAGVAGFWNDMNDPVFRVGEIYDPLAEEVLHHGVPHPQVRNLYANQMAEATTAGLAALQPGKRPFVLSRSGFLGIQRHAAVWTGDNHSTWAHLRENLAMVINLGLCGVPVSGADVGGFGRGPGRLGVLKPFRPSAELFVRWLELGALLPFFRVHSTLYAPSQEPWSFGSRALALARRILRRRYLLLPLLYRLALEAHEAGLPMVRPLFMHYDVPARNGQDQFLLGDSVLAAPVLSPGRTTREVWLPDGTWVDWNRGTPLQGGRSVRTDAPLGRTPLFVRAGAALFLAEPGRNAEDTLTGPLALEITVPPPGSVGRGSLFLDDGESTAGERFILDVAVNHAGGCLRVSLRQSRRGFEPSQRHLEIRVPSGYTRLSVDGEPRELTVRDLADQGRDAVMRVARIPLSSNEVVIT